MNIDINQTFQYIGFASEKSVNWINDFLLNFLPEATAVKSGILIWWIALLLFLYIVMALIKKVHFLIKLTLIILILWVVAGWFMPTWGF